MASAASCGECRFSMWRVPLLIVVSAGVTVIWYPQKFATQGGLNLWNFDTHGVANFQARCSCKMDLPSEDGGPG